MSRGGMASLGIRAFYMFNGSTMKDLESEAYKRRALGPDPFAVVAHKSPRDIYTDFDLWRLGIPNRPFLDSLANNCLKSDLQESSMTNCLGMIFLRDVPYGCKTTLQDALACGGCSISFTTWDGSPCSLVSSPPVTMPRCNTTKARHPSMSFGTCKMTSLGRVIVVAILCYTGPTCPNEDCVGILLDFTATSPKCSSALTCGSDVFPGAAANKVRQYSP